MKLITLVLALSFSTFAKEEIIYKYKKYEEINLDEIKIEGELGAPGEIQVSRRYLRKFKNRLPSKPNFNLEMMRGLERIR